MKQKKQKKKNKLLNILNSFHTILIVLIIIIIILLIYINYLMKSNKVYIFNGHDEYISVNNGVISLNYDINLLEGSDIIYMKEKDVIVTKYTIGYYVKDGDNLISLVVIEDEDKDGYSLKSILEGINTFNLNELNKNNKYFNNKTKKLINNGLYFVIEASTIDGEVIANATSLNVTKISK